MLFRLGENKKMNNTYKKYIDEFMPSDEIQNFINSEVDMENFNIELFANDLESEVGLTLVGARPSVGKTTFFFECNSSNA